VGARHTPVGSGQQDSLAFLLAQAVIHQVSTVVTAIDAVPFWQFLELACIANHRGNVMPSLMADFM
jgi:hypothetical protein